MTSNRTRVVGVAAALASIPFLLPTAAGANAGNGYTGSSADPESYPPLPSACADGQQWWQWTGDPNAIALSTSNPYLVLPMNVPAGLVSVPEAITWDAREVIEQEPEIDLQYAALESEESEDEEPLVEYWEKFRVEFYNDDEFLGSTPFYTQDLPDDNPYAWAVTDLGSVEIAKDANKVVLAHASTFMWTNELQNRFLPKSICVTSTPIVVEEPPTTVTPPTTVKPTANTAAALTSDCDSATLTMSNTGDAPGDVSYGIGDAWTTVNVAPGATVTKDIPLTEDQGTYVEAWANEKQVVAQLIKPDCLAPAAAAPVEVLAQTETAAPELAFTGSETTRNTGIGATLLAAGAAMIAFSRRRKVEA